MTKKKSLTPNAAPGQQPRSKNPLTEPDAPRGVTALASPERYDPNVAARAALLEASIIHLAADGAIIWRDGHLEHVASVYARNPVEAWRDYGDDVKVALTWCHEAFSALVNKNLI